MSAKKKKKTPAVRLEARPKPFYDVGDKLYVVREGGEYAVVVDQRKWNSTLSEWMYRYRLPGSPNASFAAENKLHRTHGPLLVSSTVPASTAQTAKPKCATLGCVEEATGGDAWCKTHAPRVGLTSGAKPEPDTQADIVRVCDGIKALLLKKNTAYGDSALKPMRVFSKADPVEQIKVRLDDKLSRLERGHALPDESLDDTLDDILGYLVLLKIAKERQPKLPFG